MMLIMAKNNDINCQDNLESRSTVNSSNSPHVRMCLELKELSHLGSRCQHVSTDIAFFLSQFWHLHFFLFDMTAFKKLGKFYYDSYTPPATYKQPNVGQWCTTISMYVCTIWILGCSSSLRKQMYIYIYKYLPKWAQVILDRAVYILLLKRKQKLTYF